MLASDGDENQDSPERDIVDPHSEDSYVASSERTLDSQALKHSPIRVLYATLDRVIITAIVSLLLANSLV